MAKLKSLPARMLLVLMAFLTMVIVSGFIMSRSLSDKLHQNANELINESAIFISSTLLGPEIVLNLIADNIEDKIKRGENLEKIKEYLVEASLPAFKENIRMFDYYTVYGYFDVFAQYENDLDAFIDGGGWHPADEPDTVWVASERPWYKAAVAAGGSVVVTDPYIDPSTLMPVIAYTRLIFDENGKQLAVIGLDVPLDFLALLVSGEFMTPGGYIFLLDNNLQVIVHPHDQIVGTTVYDTSYDIARFLERLIQGEELSFEKLINYQGANSILFMRSIENGWYMAKVIPHFEYFRDLYTMLLIVGILAVFLASVLIYILVLLERAQNKAIHEIKRRDNLLRSVNNTANVLLTAKDDDTLHKALVSCMKNVGQSLDIDFFEVWRNEKRGENLYAVLEHYWYSDYGVGIKAALHITEFAYEETPGWKERLEKGEFIAGPVSKLSKEDQLFLEDFKIKSALTIPVFVQEQFWGFCCIDDCRSIRMPTEDEVNILRSVSYMLANTIYRRDLTKELEEAFKRVEAASRAKSDFLSAMSHEMRTPMNAIIGMTTIGKKAKDVQNKDAALEKINDASSHLLGVINDVLDMAKIEANKLELTPIKYNFNRMVQKVISVINFRVEDKKQNLTVNVDKNIPRFVYGDDQRLAQVITNILSNAVKFTPEGGKIGLDAVLTAENNGECEIRITVTDSGIGISPEQQKRVFVAFEQAESGISREYGGTGLGLVISKRIIELMGGSINIESELGLGAKIIFTVKMKYGELDTTLKTPDKADSFEQTKGEFMGKHLLLAEDIAINREILISLLEDTGILIDCAENGKEALEKVSAAPTKYDIIFMDVQMPKMDGLESTRRIRTLGIDLPIIAITANVFMNDIEDCLAAGMNGHIGKPLDIDKVFEVLREYLK